MAAFVKIASRKFTTEFTAEKVIWAMAKFERNIVAEGKIPTMHLLEAVTTYGNLDKRMQANEAEILISKVNLLESIGGLSVDSSAGRA